MNTPTALLLWEHFDMLRQDAGGSRADHLATLASLIALRLTAYEEAAREATAARNGTAFAPTLPSGLTLSSWTKEHAEGLPKALQEVNRWPAPPGGAPLTQHIKIASTLLSNSARDHHTLTQVASRVAELPLGTTPGRQQIAEAFELLLRRLYEHEEPALGEYVTPIRLARLMIELAAPLPSERIYDPCFGAGGLLVAATESLATLANSQRGLTNSYRGNIFGRELRHIPYIIGICRLLLSGISQPRLELTDTLSHPMPKDQAREGFDCIMAVPPWGRRTHVAPRHFPIASNSIGNLFIQHVMANLRPGGRAVIAVADGVLFRHGADRAVRKTLVNDFHIDGIISLPPGAFAPYTAIPISLLHFRREPPSASVRFMRVSTGIEGPIPDDLGPSSPHEVTRALRAGTESPWLWNIPVQILAQNDYILVPSRPKGDELERNLASLLAINPALHIAVLENTSEVVTGVSYQRYPSNEWANAPPRDIGLVRVGDINAGEISPSLFLHHANIQRLREEHRLRAGDLLITKDGTIGKIGVASERTTGAIPSKGIVVIRPKETLSPSYLKILLRSPAYQAWMKEHSRGALIQHMPIGALRQLRIPVPSLHIQSLVIEETGEQGDALQVLLRIEAGGVREPLSSWLENSPTVARLLPTAELSGDLAALFNRFAMEFQECTAQLAPPERLSLSPEALSWLDAMTPIASGLSGVDEIPKGTPRVAVFEMLRPRLEEAKRTLTGSSASLSLRARAVTSGLINAIDSEVRATLKAINISLRIDPAEVPLNGASEIKLLLTNASSVGLRRISVETIPNIGKGRLAFISEGAWAEVPLVLQPSKPGPLNFQVLWQASRLDGQLVSGESMLSVLVSPQTATTSIVELGASPYVVGNPVDRREMFFGREDIIDEIKRQLGKSSANIILLEGNRRMGKTSILTQLQKKDALSDWIPIYCSFQSADGGTEGTGIPTVEVFRLMARTIGWTLADAGVKTWLPGVPIPEFNRPFKLAFRDALNVAFSDGRPFETFELYLTEAISAIHPKRALLMLDEFDKLQEGIDAGVTSPHVPENIRHLLQHHPAMSAIITGSHRLKRLREEYWSAFFGLGHRIAVTALPLNASLRLVTEPVAGRLVFLPQARDWIVELCARQPFLIQSLCSRVFELAARSGARIVAMDMVRQAMNELVPKNEHLRTLWDYCRTERRRLILALCASLAAGPDPVNLPLLELKLQEFGIPLEKRSALGDDIAYLLELEIIEFDSSYRGGTYRVTTPLMIEWIHRTIDFEDQVRRAKQDALELR